MLVTLGVPADGERVVLDVRLAGDESTAVCGALTHRLAVLKDQAHDAADTVLAHILLQNPIDAASRSGESAGGAGAASTNAEARAAGARIFTAKW